MSSAIVRSKGYRDIADAFAQTKDNIQQKHDVTATRKPLRKVDGNRRVKLNPQRGKHLIKINTTKTFRSKVLSDFGKIKKTLENKTNSIKPRKFSGELPTTPRNLRYRCMRSPDTPLNSYPFDSPVPTSVTPFRRSQRIASRNNSPYVIDHDKRKTDASVRVKSSDNFVRHLEYVVNGMEALKSNSNNCDRIDDRSQTYDNMCFAFNHITPDKSDPEITFNKRKFVNEDEKKKTVRKQIGSFKRSVTRMSLRVRNQITRSASMVAYNAASDHGSQWNALCESPLPLTLNGGHSSRNFR